MGGFVSGTAPFLLLTFVWIGLNFPAWVTWAVTPLGVISYVVPLMPEQQHNVVIGSVFLMMPVVVGIALLISRQIRALEQAHHDLAAAHAQATPRARDGTDAVQSSCSTPG
jgi:hypothetical protein